MPPYAAAAGVPGYHQRVRAAAPAAGNHRDKDAEILALRHQLVVLQRQLGERRVRFEPADRAWLAALLHQLPRPSLYSLRLLVRPDTILRWHRDLHVRRHAAASRPRRRGRPRTIRSIRALVRTLPPAHVPGGFVSRAPCWSGSVRKGLQRTCDGRASWSARPACSWPECATRPRTGALRTTTQAEKASRMIVRVAGRLSLGQRTAEWWDGHHPVSLTSTLADSSDSP
jgi:hypothetical protein